ncbi:AraC family transcriptional regulator [Polluticaenibacter yanchengensis]|uniref:AraC family transcriptional regulator n=1 Tax=Polluticaenibacter yanchengensis TaxID=3014562 RepID=A0ABT4UKF9_9BACT|nr:AraC family transcriptional regulator [Chitinophagaceae bacterium LY-5]
MKVLQFTIPVVEDGSIVVQEDKLPNFYSHFHRHAEAQITTILKGDGTLIVGNYTQQIFTGEVYMFGPNQPHMFSAQDIDETIPDNIHAIHVYFNIDKLKHSFMQFPEFSNVIKFLNIVQSGFQLPGNIAGQVTEMMIKISQSNGFKRVMLFFEMLQIMANPNVEYKVLSTGVAKHKFSDIEGLRINDIYQYSLQHYTENITLKKIAEVAHITPHAFCKYFKKHTRRTYMNFLNEIRINEACKKMLNGNYDSISSVGYAVGFNNAISFNRVFKRVIGISPTEYLVKYKRKELKEA